MLIFEKITPPDQATKPLLDALISALKNDDKTLWLVPGGSNIPLTVQVMRQIPDDLTQNLTIMLTDERYVPIDSQDSNVVQLKAAGFDSKQAKFIPTLRPNADIDAVAEQYGNNFDQASQQADHVIAQFGIGPDGHIAGIKPQSIAATTEQLAAGYQAEDFNRVTLTPVAFHRVNQAFAYVYGDSKLEPLENLLSRDLPVDQQPAQLLNDIAEVHIYNDQIEGRKD